MRYILLILIGFFTLNSFALDTRASITKSGTVTNTGVFSSLTLAQNWVAGQRAIGAFGVEGTFTVSYADEPAPTQAKSSALTIRSISANTTLVVSDDVIMCDATAGPITVALPPAATSTGWHTNMKKIDSSSNACIFDPNGSELVDVSSTLGVSTTNNSREIACDGTKWIVL